MLGGNPQTIKGNAEILVEASKVIGLEVNPEKTKYMIMSRDQNIVRNETIKIGDLSFEEVEKFKYLGATKLLSSSLLSKNLKVRIYKTVILPVVLYGCETWTLTLREEQRLRVFENKVLRKIFGAKRDEVTGEWIKLHNAELHALYPSPDIIRNIKSRHLRWAGHVARMGESRNACRVLVGRPEGKRPLGRPRRRWEDNIKMDLREVVVITKDVQNVHLLLEYIPHIDVSLTCEHDPKLQEYCVFPQNMPQFDSEGIPNQAPETNKPMILNGPTSRNREGSDQVSVETKQLGHLYLSIDQESFDPSTGEPYD
ncbi:hypothetical protein ANN_25184 [Periplaneta americana]|uniref:Reverse transcriptase domain-containing protein n=1 Tax=Periplaneta americana TaxID=6978 RepID=A0ABQ8S165_PERAM|nr:hypothetical protein ANN_25184 [Periplaneta americana]